MNRHRAYLRGPQKTQAVNDKEIGPYGPDSQFNGNDWAYGNDSSHRSTQRALLNSYIMGGYKWSGTPLYTDAHRSYYFATDAWSTKTASGNSQWQAFGVCIGRKLRQVGGYTSTSITYHGEYDPQADSFATMTALGTGRHGAASFGYPGSAGTKMVFGTGSQPAGCVATMEEYNRDADNYSSLTSMANARPSCSYSICGRIMTRMNGYNCSAGANVNEAEVYNRATDGWTSRTASGTSWREGIHASDHRYSHYTVGYYTTSSQTVAWVYKHGTDAWTNLGNQSLGSAGGNSLVSRGRHMQRGPSADGASRGLTVDQYDFHTNSLVNIADCTTTLSYIWSCNII